MGIKQIKTGDTVHNILPLYGTCSTAADTVAKVVSLDNFVLETGSRISVKFTYANSVANPTLNVNGTGAKAIYYNGGTMNSTSEYWLAGSIMDFIYDGTHWVMMGVSKNTDTNTQIRVYRQNSSYNSSSYPVLIGRTAAASSGSNYGTPGTNSTYDSTYGMFYENSSKLPTIRANPSTGALYASTFNGNGENLTNLKANNISSGTLNSNRLPTVPVTKGGTGATTAANARTNLEFTYGTAAPSGTPSNGAVYFREDVHSTLPITEGGTGATSVSAARANLGLNHVGASAVCKGSQDSANIAAGAFYQINMVASNLITTDSNFTVANNGIQCPYDGTVYITGSVYLSSSAANHGCYIYKNGGELHSQYISATSGAVTSGGMLVSVVAGDIITMKARSSVAGTVGPSNKSTHLTVIYVD